MASLLDHRPPIMEANPSQSRLLGEQEEDQDICDCISRGDQTDFIASENSSGKMNESMASNDADEFHTPSQEASFWYRRRLRNTGDTATAADSREDSAAWSLFTREVESLAPSEAGEISPETYWNLRKLDTFAMWTVEVFALVISMASFGGIVALLVAYDNEPNPGFTEVISINAIIAIFSTILKATLLFVISEVMGQLKWQWMESPRSVRDIECYVNAGAGIGGSLKFLFFTWKPLVIPEITTISMLGAIIVIASSAIGPFSQQASATSACEGLLAGKTAKVFVADVIEASMPSQMRGIAMKGFMYGASDNLVATPGLFECYTGDCDFKPHKSLALCNSCIKETVKLESASRTHQTDYEKAGFTADWPNLVNENDTSYVFRMNTMFTPMPKENSSTGPSITDSLLGEIMTVSTTTITTSDPIDGTRNPRADESGRIQRESLSILTVNCTMYPCLRSYESKVSNGSLREHVVSQVPLHIISNMGREGSPPSDENYGDFMFFQEPCVYQKQWFTAGNISSADKTLFTPNGDWIFWRINGALARVPNECTRVFSANTYGSIQKFVDRTIKGSCNVSGSDDDLEQLLKTVDCGEKWWLDSVFDGGEASFASISTAFDGMATAITSLVRTTGTNWTRTSQGYVNGTMNETTVCVKAYWLWMIYPGSLLVLTITLFATTFAQNILGRRERPVWKSSVLPLIFYNIRKQKRHSGVLENDSHKKTALLQLFELEKEADDTVVRFDNDQDFPAFIEDQVEEKSEATLIEPTQSAPRISFSKFGLAMKSIRAFFRRSKKPKTPPHEVGSNIALVALSKVPHQGSGGSRESDRD